MKSIYKILGIIMILAVVSLSGCIGEDVIVDEELDVVIEDVLVEDSAEDPIADESDGAVEPADDEPEDEVISTPSSSGSSGKLVAGVDGSTGHGDEIKARYAAVAAAKSAELARLEALATLEDAINASTNASLEAFAAEEVYSDACDLMNATIYAQNVLYTANATTLAALDNKTIAQEAFDVMYADLENETLLFNGYNESEEAENSTAIYDALNETLVQATEDFNEAEEALESATDVYNDAVGAEADVHELYDEAVEAFGIITQEAIDELGVTATEAREAANAALAYLEECQAAYDILNPVEDPEE